MSYAFKITPTQSLSAGFSEVDIRDNTFDLPQNTYVFERDDVIHITYSDGNFKKGLYAVCTGTGTTAGFTFDQRIYTRTTSIAQGDVLGATIYRGDSYSKISDVNINVSVNHGIYSNEYKSYKTSKDYQLIVNEEKRDFFDSFDDVAYAEKVIFADYCNSYAYGVAFSEERFGLLNNTFSSSLAFNIATR